VHKEVLPKRGTSGAVSYTWFADGVQIDGTTPSTLVLRQEHVGKSISINASYTDLLGTTETVSSSSSSPATNVNDAPTGLVVIEGNLTQGQTLAATNTLADLDGLGTVTYQWNAGGKAIVGATSDSYVLTQAQVGQTISVTASYIDGFGKAERVTSLVSAKVANANDAPTGQITMTGTVAEDQTLRALTSTLADVDGLGRLRFQWQSSSDGTTWNSINKASAATYKLGDSDVGKYVRATVSYTDKLGTAESVTSEASDLVANVNDKPKGVPTVSGKFIEGELLTANTARITDADGLGTFSYLWQTSTDRKTWIDAGTDATLQLSGTSARQSVQLTVSYTDGGGTVESIKSTVSAAIATKALTLLGGGDADTLTGWSGADRITGGGGADALTGGAGADVFIYRSVDDSLPTSFDNILDFSAADKIDLRGIDAMTSRAGDQAFAFSRNGAAKNAVWWDTGTLYGDNTGDAVADFAIYVNLVGLPDIKASNIIL
jgi:Ca2+-binding RTX toxin-like protein